MQLLLRCEYWASDSRASHLAVSFLLVFVCSYFYFHHAPPRRMPQQQQQQQMPRPPRSAHKFVRFVTLYSVFSVWVLGCWVCAKYLTLWEYDSKIELLYLRHIFYMYFWVCGNIKVCIWVIYYTYIEGVPLCPLFILFMVDTLTEKHFILCQQLI